MPAIADDFGRLIEDAGELPLGKDRDAPVPLGARRKGRVRPEAGP
ncbi:hypothetical protein AAH991_12475 [Microbispora sp. ZYX-F-249]|uniref:Uncharacterized protein n=1 Tax=Microbispora maris TaxID=3144104 RepID=A0ABV0AKS8_9ACTN